MYEAISRSEHPAPDSAAGGAQYLQPSGSGASRAPSEGLTAVGRRQRAAGASRLSIKAGNRIDELYQRTPCRMLFPRSDFSGSLEAVLVNTAGGLTGGDAIRQSVAVADGAAGTITTQAAEKIYRAADGRAAVTTDLRVDEGGRLEWLPQETIAFDGAAFSRTTTLDLAGNARALALEWLVLGRRAHGETLRRGHLVDRWRVRRDGRLVWADTLLLDGDIQAVTGWPSQMNGSAALATVLCAGPDAEAMRDQARASLADFDGTAVLGGASLLDGLMICRVLARDGDALRPAMRRLIADLRDLFWSRPVGLPRVWHC